MKTRIIAAIIRLLSDDILDEIQDLGLSELDRRGLIIWADQTQDRNK